MCVSELVSECERDFVCAHACVLTHAQSNFTPKAFFEARKTSHALASPTCGPSFWVLVIQKENTRSQSLNRGSDMGIRRVIHKSVPVLRQTIRGSTERENVTSSLFHRPQFASSRSYTMHTNAIDHSVSAIAFPPNHICSGTPPPLPSLSLVVVSR